LLRAHEPIAILGDLRASTQHLNPLVIPIGPDLGRDSFATVVVAVDYFIADFLASLYI